MTQVEARNAVKNIRSRVSELLDEKPDEEILEMELVTIFDELEALYKHLSQNRPVLPNCRPATKEELETLCRASNVVMFPAVA